MSTTADLLPLTHTVAPETEAALVEAVRQAYADSTPVYPIGGGTSLDYGVPPRQSGIGVSLTGLNRVIDYPARDMTITVEAGITMARLAQTLAAEGQRLPIDTPQAEQATLGGVIATNFSGPRRYGLGTIRDYVIGIAAVDGRGILFHGGGRVVKNVAGYDFCKLLTGSLGTLGVISQVTLKVRPRPEASALIACGLAEVERAEPLLAALVTSRTAPTAIELLAGPAWDDDVAFEPGTHAPLRLVVGFEGTRVEVAWQVGQLQDEWRALGVTASQVVASEQTPGLWNGLTEFPAGPAPLVLKVSVPPGAVTAYVQRVMAIDPACSIQAHAGNGIVIARFAKFTTADVSRIVIGALRPAAVSAGGHAVVLSSTLELTHQAVWGSGGGSVRMMKAVKDQFDPRGILNPGRFVC
jgi:glycolate oxidase FAD binding subunit